MKIKNIGYLSIEEIKNELDRGGKFVVYQYCISIFVMTFRRCSDIYFIKNGQSKLTKGVLYSFLTLFLGWWGFPWGPIYSIGSLSNNFSGGKDVTKEVLTSLSRS